VQTAVQATRLSSSRCCSLIVIRPHVRTQLTIDTLLSWHGTPSLPPASSGIAFVISIFKDLQELAVPDYLTGLKRTLVLGNWALRVTRLSASL
jgi:hypothetical protein